MHGDGFAGPRSGGPQRQGNESGDPRSPALAVEDNGLDIGRYLGILLRHRFLIGGAIVAALIIGLAATLLMTPIYTAKATIQIDRETQQVLGNGTESAPRDNLVNGVEFFETQYGLLRSRSLAERVADSMGLANSNDFITRMGGEAPTVEEGNAAQRTAQRRRRVIGLLRANLSVAPVRGSRLVTISFNSPDPQLAAQIANAFAENFIQASLERKFESSSYVRQFLEQQIAQTKAKLEETERTLVEYASGQQIINITEPGAEGGGGQSLAANNLVSINSALADARAARVAAEEKWRQARTSPLMSIPDVLQNTSIQRLSEQRSQLDAEYQQKLAIYQPDYPEMIQLRSRIDELEGQINALATSIRNSIRAQFEIASNQETSLQAQVTGLTGDVLDLRDRSIQYNILQRELDTSRTLYDGLLQRYKEVGVTGGVTTNNISVIDMAMTPGAPSKPDMTINLLMALLLGIGLGVAAALVIEMLDESIATPDDVERKLGLSVLGVVPLLHKGETALTALNDIRSGFSEAYYSLRTALQFSTPDGAPPVMLVTSSRPGEGKSTTAYAVALNLARIGKRVLLADGDLRNPSMHRLIGIENSQGMSSLLSGGATLPQVVRKTSHENLFFISCGPLPPNPAELWGGERLRETLHHALQEFDHIVIDGPPVLGFADAPLLAATVGSTLFVLESRNTRRAQAKGAMKRLSMVHGQVLGVVLTKFNATATPYGGYDYAYDYTYGADPDTTTTDKKPK